MSLNLLAAVTRIMLRTVRGSDSEPRHMVRLPVVQVILTR